MSNIVNLAKYTTLGIGGMANVIVASDLNTLTKYSAPVILGNGSNVLVSDKGLSDAVLLNRARSFHIDGDELYAQSGCLISFLALACAQSGLSGLEWAYALPASVGGALVMNCGAFGSCVSDSVKRVGVYREGEIIELSASDCGFSYRASAFRKSDIILYAHFTLARADKAECMERIEKVRALRLLQPKGKSAGCIYKTEGKSAGWYIERAGLKNKRIGDIYVSPVHAGFFINAGRGTAKDMVALMDYVEKTVQDKFNKTLSREIKLIGEF